MIYPIVLGTAGHIDHGKTSLVRELTGIDTDRLAVEKARGITTELGFARLDLGERRIAVVDVPGHERFVKSMVAGATGLDLVMLVVAADEGIMPQTREHLEICDLLGVRCGLIALTKLDLVESDWLALISTEVRSAAAGTFLAAAPIVPVSTRTGEGMEPLRTELAHLVDSLPPRESKGLFRLPVDRVFSVKGFGTVVTGTTLGGCVKMGDELTVIPSGMRVRVRGLEVHGVAVEEAFAGHRTAVNLGGIAVSDLTRGEMLVHPGKVIGSHILDVELRHTRGAAGSLPVRGKVLLHHATAQYVASYVLLEGTELPPGETAPAQLRLSRELPIGALPGDRFIVRGFVASPTAGSTLGGGRIVRVLAPKARDNTLHAQTVGLLADAKIEQRISLDVRTAAAATRTRQELEQRLGISSLSLDEPLATLVASGDLLATAGQYIHAEVVADIEHRITRAIDNPEGMLREELRTRLPAALPTRVYDAILSRLAERGALIATGDRVRKPVPRPAISAVEATLLAKLESAGLEPPRPKELPALLGLAEPQVKLALDHLVAAKLAVRVKPDLIMHSRSVEEIRHRLVQFLDEHTTIDAQQWKELTNASRKYTIPLAEYFDGEKLTLRIGDLRRKRDQKK